MKRLEFLGILHSSEKHTFGFKLYKCPPFLDNLVGFQSDLFVIVDNVKFRSVRNNFLPKLKDDVKVINNTKDLIVNADKSNNIYKINKDIYNKYLTKNIIKTYKKKQTIKLIE